MARTVAEFERIYGPPGRLDFGQRILGCLVGGCDTRDTRPNVGSFIECCHLTNGGTGRKADARHTVFCCWRHHDEMDAGKQSFEEKYRGRLKVGFRPVVCLEEAADETERQWYRYGLEVW